MNLNLHFHSFLAFQVFVQSLIDNLFDLLGAFAFEHCLSDLFIVLLILSLIDFVYHNSAELIEMMLNYLHVA